MQPLRRPVAILPLLALAGFLLAFAPQAVARGHARGSGEARLVVSAGFEQSLAGWIGFRARLHRVRGGVASRWAVSVTFANGSPSDGFSVYAKAPQTVTAAGATYTGGAWVKGARSGRRLCLRVRERSGTSETGGATSCLTSDGRWQHFAPASYTASVPGRNVDVYVYEWSPRRNDSFSVDRVTLATSLASASTSTTVPVSTTAPSTTTVAPPKPVTALIITTTSSSGPPKQTPTAATTTASTVATTTAAQPAPPPSGPAPWYSSGSPFNQAIPADAGIDPASPAMVQALVAGAGGGFAISAKQWTPPVYYADAQTPRVAVSITMGWFPARSLIGVPMPADATPDATSDGHLMVIDRSTGCEYDFWQAQRHADGSWSASTANAIPMSGTGVYSGGWATTAAGFALGLGKIRPEEMAAGEIRHALVFGFPTTKAGGPVWPATSSDGRSSSPGAIPEGARLQLDPSLDLDSLGLTAWQKTIARALQRYGMILGDTGGTVGLSAVNASNLGTDAYPWGNVSYAYLPTSLLSHFRVLTLGPQSNPPGALVPTSCATYGF